ncbi:hypothetical protein ACR807_41600, partial [Saccharothrix sp. Mg75]
NAGVAATAAKTAGNNAAEAADAAAQAGNFAEQAGADAALARNAAAAARSAAARANRAADAAISFANTAADAAGLARDAANRAAENAIAAANAAEDAANHAGNSVDAARKSTEHANAASQAADTAIQAATQAQQIYDAARASDEARVATERDQAVEAAQAAKAAAGPTTPASRWDTSSQARRDTETAQLLAAASGPGADPALVVANGRKIAVKLAQSGGPWTKSAALAALAGSDDEVRDFVRTGITSAAGQDDRVTLRSLLVDGSDAFKRAAEAALAGSDADVQRFLDQRLYPERATEDRVKVNQVLAAASTANRTVTKAAAQKALDAGTVEAYRKFLTQEQFTTAATDDRIAVNRVLASPGSGPETKASAQAALDGPSAFQQRFLSTVLHQATQRDQEQAGHNAEVAAYVAKAWNAAASASENASRAQEVAAVARGAAEEAVSHAQQAQRSADQAADYARQAHDSATAAEKSAQDAANSARTAQQAAASADASARRASQSAVWAQASANQAQGFAVAAYQSAEQAYDSAIAAGKDAEQAAAAANEAIAHAQQMMDDEITEAAFRQANYCAGRYGEGTPKYTECIHLITASADELVELAFRNGEFCVLLYGDNKGAAGYENCLRDVLNPDFKLNRYLDAMEELLVYVKAATFTLYAGLGVTALVLCGISLVCGSALLAMDPLAAAISPWLVTAGAATAGVTFAVRVGSRFEFAVVESELAAARAGRYDLGRLLGLGNRLCARSFTASAPMAAQNDPDCLWDVADEVVDALEDQFSFRVAEGVAYNIRRYNEGAQGHALNGIGKDVQGLARYLAAREREAFRFYDSRTHKDVMYDEGNQVLIIRDSSMIHAYNYKPEDWRMNVGSKYLER